MFRFLLTVFLICTYFSCIGQTDFQVHRYHDPNIGFINIYLVETSNHLVLIDAGLTNYHAEAINQLIDSLDKPLHSILLTHGHIDHYAGLSVIESKAPILSSKGVAQEIEQNDTYYMSRFTNPQLSSLIPKTRIGPTKIVDDNYSFKIDHVRFNSHNMGAGESLDDIYWEVTHKKTKHAFVGDLVLNQMHAFFQSGYSENWKKSLIRLAKTLHPKTTIYPGHGEIGGKDILHWQIKYIDTYKATVAELLKKGNEFGEKERAYLIDQMTDFLPGERANFLISWSLPTIIDELSHTN
ncbi:Glyoxylase, beta-lactamase superfamily II [Reichenbachiella faecimaris]|uniref:Glyoxylase, beta-lactamase superfamily II n=1 Tax=Reichenbachiella faecimaris TaxID=692418 RepID=A0A1W2GIA4_REIFA|nr:MBL fold metallo-hydrolase [Reichenbachiella faecimaris]SMD36301.1 Glyoxylase, beta-lactamase superfamily II [Reichenbachiella faecimaris]